MSAIFHEAAASRSLGRWASAPLSACELLVVTMCLYKVSSNKDSSMVVASSVERFTLAAICPAKVFRVIQQPQTTLSSAAVRAPYGVAMADPELL